MDISKLKSDWKFNGASALRLDSLARGTRILTGSLLQNKRRFANIFRGVLKDKGFVELELPSLEPKDLYTEKAGDEILKQMYVLDDLCLRPEGTATCQALAKQYANIRDLAVYYETRCWRLERPQEGRYREFTQFGVEILNPRQDYTEFLTSLSTDLISLALPKESFQLNEGVKRGLAYYTDGVGWEIECSILGAQKQILGAGSYPEGIGFAIGMDRLALAKEKLSLEEENE